MYTIWEGNSQEMFRDYLKKMKQLEINTALNNKLVKYSCKIFYIYIFYISEFLNI